MINDFTGDMAMQGQPGASGHFHRIRGIILNAERVVVRAQCHHCGELSELNWAALALSHSEEKTLRTLARIIRCRSCGARGCGWIMSGNADQP